MSEAASRIEGKPRITYDIEILVASPVSSQERKPTSSSIPSAAAPIAARTLAHQASCGQTPSSTSLPPNRSVWIKVMANSRAKKPAIQKADLSSTSPLLKQDRR